MIEKIETLRRAHRLRTLADQIEADAATPFRRDHRQLPQLYAQFCKCCPTSHKYHARLFVAVAVFLFSPESFIRHTIRRNGLRKHIAAVLSAHPTIISTYFHDAKSLILHHPAFKREAQRLFLILK